MVTMVGFLYRRMLTGSIVGLAVLLYALEDAALSFWCFVALLRGSGCSSGLRGDDARRLHLAKDVTYS